MSELISNDCARALRNRFEDVLGSLQHSIGRSFHPAGRSRISVPREEKISNGPGGTCPPSWA
jgi:hypothetical protein